MSESAREPAKVKHSKLDALDGLDRSLLASIIRDPDAAYSKWAEQVGMSARTVRRRYEQLRRQGIVRVFGRTLPGFGGRIAWLARIHGAPGRLGPIASELATLETTRWVRLSRDRGELICGVVTVPSIYDDLLFRLNSSVPARDIQVHQLLQVWGQPGSVTSGAETIDDIDRLLLDAYAKDGRASATEIAASLGLDPATVSRHRRRLVDSGILYFEADVHPDALSESGDLNIWMRVRPGHIAALGRRLRDMPETRFVAAISGQHQIVANVVLPSASDAITFIDDLWECGIVDIEMVPMGHALKRSAGS
ncbi:Lrp/AsnC family transcriptional regulator [Corynebacterium phoceense]|uniref:Lrp/AsnC family transcriptional regulator n=1 Tax=Corynebacterium phoceense TaxID=1686286 RepID=UPI00211C756F|nr:winged helix-turn-helix transcriptional regulator [Corynebacterium phoceense]